jgi:thioredoxin 1
VKVGKMDVDRNSATPMRYKVTGIPTLLVFKGGQVVEQLVGYRPKEAIQQALEKHIPKDAIQPAAEKHIG